MKGVAIILMLIHHLFYNDDLIQRCTLILPYEEKLLLLFSSLSKVCVAIFVLISGYGLYKSYLSTTETGVGYKKTAFFTPSYLESAKTILDYCPSVCSIRHTDGMENSI